MQELITRPPGCLACPIINTSIYQNQKITPRCRPSQSDSGGLNKRASLRQSITQDSLSESHFSAIIAFRPGLLRSQILSTIISLETGLVSNN
jgi:hypothetical protein